MENVEKVKQADEYVYLGKMFINDGKWMETFQDMQFVEERQ